jgi:hypothetical protein
MSIPDLWVPVIAALGASALTGMVAFGMEWWRSNKEGKSALSERRARAYSMLLARSAVIAHFAGDLHAVMEVRSGLREGLDVMLGKQKSVDLLELSERVRADLEPIYEAWSEVWTVGSQEAIAEANELVAQCGAVVGAATQRGKARPEFLIRIAGEKWTQEQLDQWGEELRSLAQARRRLAVVARREAGVEVAELFTPASRNTSITFETKLKSDGLARKDV